ncbi:MAG: hypothetical protein JWR33_1616 [Naasia sp.]|jgi:hypothetical protein|uniref:hypothetical protein n=1 Tax=Naasia sp. TaxID=2546198 RepID=UPI0026392F24|nr:hypothetical protein [Naasia sp.]MCU1570875.1 hypothetical protein [Naasia sp.]
MRTPLLALIAAVAVAGLTLAAPGAAFAAKAAPGAASSTLTSLGNDVSWPQCGKTLPSAPAFAVVGVNGGLANDTNPCFAQQLSWAQRSTTTAAPGQPNVALYVNTANPGFAGSGRTSPWPASNTYGGTTVPNPYGTCTPAPDGGASYTAACAYMYGYARAYDDLHSRGVTGGAGYTWWLDVETENTWHPTDKPANAAVLEGMTDLFHSVRARVGIYSTSSQWGAIAGTLRTGSSLAGLDNWIPGATSEKGARSNCALSPFTPGSRITLTQFVSKNLDYNVSCIG